jgi:hypothetical protein
VDPQPKQRLKREFRARRLNSFELKEIQDGETMETLPRSGLPRAEMLKRVAFFKDIQHAEWQKWTNGAPVVGRRFFLKHPLPVENAPNAAIVVDADAN